MESIPFLRRRAQFKGKGCEKIGACRVGVVEGFWKGEVATLSGAAASSSLNLKPFHKFHGLSGEDSVGRMPKTFEERSHNEKGKHLFLVAYIMCTNTY